MTEASGYSNTFSYQEYISFTINGKLHEIRDDIPIEMSLNTYLREVANLKGTKFMCEEGGCGSCIVTVKSVHPWTKSDQVHAVNSCLMPVLSCHGAAITTIEGIGNRFSGYNVLQSRLAMFNGTQCGFCSPGMVMNMYSLLKANPNATMAEIEDSFGGNICRCTGYRSISDAFKSFGSDVSTDLKDKCSDIEDIHKVKCITERKCGKGCQFCIKTNRSSDEDYSTLFSELSLSAKFIKLNLKNDIIWYKVSSKSEIFQIFDMIGNKSYMLVGGNTAQGVYCNGFKSDIYIDIKDVPELRNYIVYRDYIDIGANITLNELKDLFYALSKENPLMFAYMKVMADHINLVANPAIRNVATLAGNLTIKYKYREFQSDLFLILETCGAHVIISEISGVERTVSLLEYLSMDMKKKIISRVILPALSSNHYYMQTYKIMPRAQNAHAVINAGFLFRFDPIKKALVVEKPTIVFGGVSANFTHAYQTESFLNGAILSNSSTLNSALNTLSLELRPNSLPPEPSPLYRKNLALGLFYRFILSVNLDEVKDIYKSGAFNLSRPLSSGKQNYETNKKEWPVNQPLPKLEGLIQCSGEAEYVNDIPTFPGELHAELVICDVGPANLVSIDATKALKTSGVVAFYSAKDIPGKNVFTVINTIVPEEEQLFASQKIIFAGQVVGIIVAESREIAIQAAKLVHIIISDEQKPLLSVSDVLKYGNKSRVVLLDNITPVKTKEGAKYKIFGSFETGSQYHFTLETQSCLCVPSDIGLDVYSATQWVQSAQEAISVALNIPESSINMKVKRLGGGFGSKITRASMIATSCALAAYKLNRPVRMVLDLRTNTKAIGKRNSSVSNYEVGVNESGQIQYLKLDIYENIGCSLNDPLQNLTKDGVINGYDISTWKVNIYGVITDLPSSVWTRAPGTVEAMATIENLMEHIAFEMKLDPIKVRLANFPDNSIMKDLIPRVLLTCDFENRLIAVADYNIKNRWKKRGIAMSVMNFEIVFNLIFYSTISIYAHDGTVALTHGGIEVGQGVNTKAAQVCAYELGIPIDNVKVKPSSNITSPNNGPTGASITSDSVTQATLECCKIINTRLEPIKKKLVNATWQQIVAKAYEEDINLNASYMCSKKDPIPSNYVVQGGCVLEMEVDILTGQYQIMRADIVEDAGESLNPAIDVGQMEGAFVMGLGYYLTEEIKHDPNSGRLLTDRTWNYYPPGIKDIPIDFRIYLLGNSPNPVGTLRSKAVGEPPLCLSMTALFALRKALESARADAKLNDEWFPFNPPCTTENVQLSSGTNPTQFDL